MKKYYYIIKNSFWEANHSWFIITMQLIQPLGEMYGLMLLYSYILNPNAGLGGISQEVTIYYLFILTAGSTVLPMFSEGIRKDIVDDSYLNIEKLPINPAVYYILSNIAKNIIPLGVFSVVTIIYLFSTNTEILVILLFIPSVIISLCLSHLIFFTFTCINFYAETASVWLFRAIFDFTSGRWIPLQYIPVTIRYVLYIFPFPYAFGALAKNFSQFKLLEFTVSTTIAIFWVIALSVISTHFWHKGSYYFQENS